VAVTSDLEADPLRAAILCRAGHLRLAATVEGVTDEQARSAGRLPGWTIAHVLTHLARNADGHSRRLEGALRGEDVPRYPGGPAQRQHEIDEGAGRSTSEILADLHASQGRLELVWDRCVAAGWPNAELLGDDHWPTTASPVRRMREVEMHHIDLGLGYEASSWPDEYVDWELPKLMATVPSRVQRAGDARALLLWLSGRQSVPSAIELEPW
jgi:maleylpyruvate isomerase